MRKYDLTSIAAAVAIALQSSGALAMSDADYEQKAAAINAKYQPTYDAASKEGADIEEESETCLVEATFDADWELTKVSFDIPEVFMKNRELSFDTLKSKMSTKVLGSTKIPVFEWGITKVMGVKMHVPKTYMKNQEIRVQVPEFWWDRTSFVMKIPEFYSKRVEWKFHILKIKELEELSLPCEQEKKRAKQLGSQMESVTAAHKGELNAVTREYLAVKLEEMDLQRGEMEKQFDDGLGALANAIEAARQQGIDPATAMVDFNGEKLTMIGCLEALQKQKIEALKSIDGSREQLTQSLMLLT